MFSPPKISWVVSGLKYICVHLLPVFYLIQPSSKQIICFDFQKQNSVLPIVFYVPCEVLGIKEFSNTKQKRQHKNLLIRPSFRNQNLLFCECFNRGTQNTIGSTLFCFQKSKQKICLLEGWIRQKTGSKCKEMYFIHEMTQLIFGGQNIHNKQCSTFTFMYLDLRFIVTVRSYER